MKILVTGARGFIGAGLSAGLKARGHVVVAGVHQPPREAVHEMPWVAVDFTRDTDASAWLPRLAGIDAVVNTVGIFRERRAQTFLTVHVAAARALFDACAACGIARVVQLSALGADEHATTAYHRSKRAADDALLERVPSAWCAQPSIVHGPGGASARLFNCLASLPVIPVPGRGEQRLQPVHLDDVIAALCALVEHVPAQGGRVALVGPAPIRLRDYLLALRAALGLSRTAVVTVPRALVRAGARLAARVPGALLDPSALDMLERGNTADAADITRLIGHPPRAPERFVAARDAGSVRVAARLAWLLPLLRGGVALVWVVTGIVSLGIYPLAQSYALLARVGAPPAWQPLLLYGAALLDLLLGVLVFALRGTPRRWLWRAQAALILGYSLLIAWRLPEFWLHPFGPLVKNIPLLAVLVLLDVLEPRERDQAGAS